MTATKQLQVQSHYLEINATDKLHIKRFFCDRPKDPILMVHGAIENGRIFYSSTHKGLAPFLALQGYDVYVLDLRGRGESTPLVNAQMVSGQYEDIVEDIPKALEFIVSIRSRIPQYWIAHSWGGVLLSSYFARFDQYRDLVKGIVYFGAKRCIRVMNWQRLLIIELLWKRVVPMLIAYYGYLPAKRFWIGADNESRNSYFEGSRWVEPNPWIDPRDGFNYGTAILKLNLPPILYFAGIKDHYLGHPKDVLDFMKESGESNAEFRLLSRANGNLHDYDHINMLTHPDALKDHFLYLLDWLNRHNSLS